MFADGASDSRALFLKKKKDSRAFFSSNSRAFPCMLFLIRWPFAEDTDVFVPLRSKQAASRIGPGFPALGVILDVLVRKNILDKIF